MLLSNSINESPESQKRSAIKTASMNMYSRGIILTAFIVPLVIGKELFLSRYKRKIFFNFVRQTLLNIYGWSR